MVEKRKKKKLFREEGGKTVKRKEKQQDFYKSQGSRLTPRVPTPLLSSKTLRG